MPALQPRNSPVKSWHWPVVDVLVQSGRFPIILSTLGTIVSVLGWLLFAPPYARSPWRVLALWTFPVAVTLPVLSMDAYNYADYAWIAASGYPANETGLATLRSPTASVVDQWVGLPSPYPPLHTFIAEGAAGLTGFAPVWSALAMRLPSLVGLLLISWCVPKIADEFDIDVGWAQWGVCLSPLTILHGVGGAHSEMWALALGLPALLAGARGRMVVGSVLAGAALAIRPTAVVIMVAVAIAALRGVSGRGRIGARLAASLVIASLSSVAVSAITHLGWGWLKQLGGQTQGPSLSPSRVFAELFGLIGPFAQVFGEEKLKTLGCILIFAGALGALVVRRDLWRGRPLRLVSYLAVAATLASPYLQPWYFLPCLALLAVSQGDLLSRSLIVGLTVLVSVPPINPGFPPWIFGPTALVSAVQAAGLLRVTRASWLPSLCNAAPRCGEIGASARAENRQ